MESLFHHCSERVAGAWGVSTIVTDENLQLVKIGQIALARNRIVEVGVPPSAQSMDATAQVSADAGQLSR